jgi:hypothetical protein
VNCHSGEFTFKKIQIFPAALHNAPKATDGVCPSMKSMLFHVFMAGNIPGCAPEVSVLF